MAENRPSQIRAVPVRPSPSPAARTDAERLGVDDAAILRLGRHVVPVLSRGRTPRRAAAGRQQHRTQHIRDYLHGGQRLRLDRQFAREQPDGSGTANARNAYRPSDRRHVLPDDRSRGSAVRAVSDRRTAYLHRQHPADRQLGVFVVGHAVGLPADRAGDHPVQHGFGNGKHPLGAGAGNDDAADLYPLYALRSDLPAGRRRGLLDDGARIRDRNVTTSTDCAARCRKD